MPGEVDALCSRDGSPAANALAITLGAAADACMSMQGAAAAAAAAPPPRRLPPGLMTCVSQHTGAAPQRAFTGVASPAS
jgi:hypothetical protein